MNGSTLIPIIKANDVEKAKELIAAASSSEEKAQWVNFSYVDPAGYRLRIYGYQPRKLFPLMLAAEAGSGEMVKLLLETGALPNKKDNFRQTALHCAAAKGNRDVIRQLLEFKADPNQVDYDKQTALHWAASGGHAAIIRQLLEFGAHPDQVDCDRQTALHRAATRGHAEVIKQLLEFGADPDLIDEKENLPLHNIAIQPYEKVKDVLSLLIAKTTKLNHVGRCGTVLHSAASFGNIELVNCLLKAGAEVNQQDQYGHTPIFGVVSARKRKIELAGQLLTAGANIFHKDLQGDSVLYRAAQKSSNLTNYLLAQGAGLMGKIFCLKKGVHTSNKIVIGLRMGKKWVHQKTPGFVAAITTVAALEEALRAGKIVCSQLYLNQIQGLMASYLKESDEFNTLMQVKNTILKTGSLSTLCFYKIQADKDLHEHFMRVAQAGDIPDELVTKFTVLSRNCVYSP